MSNRPCYIFDIDGTLADLTHRLPHIQKSPKDWDAFFESCDDDDPIEHVCTLANSVRRAASSVIFVSGRSDRVHGKTRKWLERHVGLWALTAPLYMRRDGDHRPDHVVKLELLEEIREHGYEPIMAFDDRDQVVKMWREAGVPCAQVAPGDF